MNLLFIDMLHSGISGDMFLAALLNLIPDAKSVMEELMELKNYLPNVQDLNIGLTTVERSGIMVNQLIVEIREDKHHRTSEILEKALYKFLSEKEYSEPAKNYAEKVLKTLIQAEANVHKTLSKKVHLHELSSVDTLIDILGVSRALEKMNVFNNDLKVYCGKVPLGGGTIKVAHGILPIPAPATLKILEMSDLIVFNGPIESELVTPTGAALLVNLKPIYSAYSSDMILKKTIYSTGTKNFDDFPNILRIYLGEVYEDAGNEYFGEFNKYVEDVSILETNVDDISGEMIGNFIQLIEKDVLDIQVMASLTKKNRPSHIIKIICHPNRIHNLLNMFFEELGTLGVRINTLKRVCVERSFESMKTTINGHDYEIKYKISYIESPNERRIVNIKPEYEDLKSISQKTGLSVKMILQISNSNLAKILSRN